jgi:TRAP-type C4-dicarboxylate transport system permease small subunit
MTALVFANVVGRYVFNDPIQGADELATLGFTWATFLGASLGVRLRLHLGIEYLTQGLGPRPRAAVGLLVVLLMAAFAALLVVYGTRLMLSGHFKRTPVLQWPYTWVYLAVPVGGLLMLARLGGVARQHLGRLRPAAPAGAGARGGAAPP